MRPADTIGDNIITYLFFGGGDYFRKFSAGTLHHDIVGGITYCNVMIGAVFPRKE